jgi:polyisoprenoid-binding protein YceI
MATVQYANAHHAFAVDYDADKMGSIEGTVLEVFYKNPHARYYVEVEGEDGQMETWDVQTMNLMRLSSLGWKKDTVKVGDKVAISGNLGRNNSNKINILTLEQESGKVWRPMGGIRGEAPPGLSEDGSRPSAAAAIEPGVYKLDPSHAYLSFSYSHLGLSHPKLRFREFEADMTLDGQEMKNSRVAIEINAGSIDSAVAAFDDELKGEGFFDVDNYPSINFISTSYEETSPTTGHLSGELTIKGVSRPVTLDVTINNAAVNPMSNKPQIGFTAKGTLLRSEFGFDAGLPMIGDEVSLVVQTEFEKSN